MKIAWAWRGRGSALGMLASGAPGRSNCTAMRFSAVWPVEGRRPEPSSAMRSPPRISRAPSASVSRSARSSFSGQISRRAPAHGGANRRATARRSAPPPIRFRARTAARAWPIAASRCAGRRRRCDRAGTARRSRPGRPAAGHGRPGTTVSAIRSAATSNGGSVEANASAALAERGRVFGHAARVSGAISAAHRAGR